MHSRLGTWEEARRVYLEPSRVEEKGPAEEVVIWDVGMGIAANALTAIAHTRCRLRIISFENDLDGMCTALAHAERFDLLLRFRRELAQLVSEKSISLENGLVNWQLLEGNFFACLRQNVDLPDLIFWDFYSPSVFPSLWSTGSFRAILPHLKPSTLLLTYAAATPVRSAMILAGLQVGRGVATPAKSETTEASLDRSGLRAPLGPEWLRKVSVSSQPFPYDFPEPLDRAKLLSLLQESPHFNE